MNVASPPPLPATTKTWWQRHWKWLAVLGGLAVVGWSVAFVGVLQGAMRGSEPFQIALKQARAHPAVIAALGSPLETGWFVAGHLQHYGLNAEANLVGDLKGPLGRGQMNVSGKLSGGSWKLETTVVVAKTGEKIVVSRP